MSVIGEMRRVLPDAVASFLSSQAQITASGSQITLGFGFFASLGVAILGARAATAATMTALNIAYSIDQTRGILRFQLVAIGLTICAALYGLFAITLLAILPLASEFLHLGTKLRHILQFGRWPVFVLLVILFLGAIYRFAPAQRQTRWRWVSPGAFLAAALWLALSYLFSLYVARFAPYQAAFGPSSSVVILLTWLYLSVYSVLLGAELNAVLSGVDNAAEVMPKRPKSNCGRMREGG